MLTPEELAHLRRVARNSEGGLDLSAGGALAAAVVGHIDALTKERDEATRLSLFLARVRDRLEANPSLEDILQIAVDIDNALACGKEGR